MIAGLVQSKSAMYRFATLLTVVLCCSPLRAAPSFPPITKSDYLLDVYSGAVIGSTRVIGLGGAYVSVAEGSEGIRSNPASVANRPYFSGAAFDWGLAFDFLLPTSLGRAVDLDNNGRTGIRNGVALTTALGGHLHYREFGAGVYLTIDPALIHSSSQDFDASVVNVYLAMGFGLFRNQLILGGGLHVGLLSLKEQGKGTELFAVQSTALELGAVYRPTDRPFRLGAAISVPIAAQTSSSCGPPCPDLHLPQGARLPWELRLGASWRWGTAYNPIPAYYPRAGSNPGTAASRPGARPTYRVAPSGVGGSSGQDRAPSSRPQEPAGQDLDREYRGGRYLLLSAEVVVVGAREGLVGMEGFLLQEREPVGEKVTLSPRIGAEAELLRRRLRLRLGSYYEAGRFSHISGRLHGTSSLLVRLFDLRLWGHHGISFAPGVDVAPRYVNVSFFLSLWH